MVNLDKSNNFAICVPPPRRKYVVGAGSPRPYFTSRRLLQSFKNNVEDLPAPTSVGAGLFYFAYGFVRIGKGFAFTQPVKMIVPLLARMRNQYCVFLLRPVTARVIVPVPACAATFVTL